MSNHDGGYIVGIEMEDLEREEDPDDPGDQPMEERSALMGSPFKDMFQCILTTYDNERTWWVAVENLLLSESGDFTAKVASKTQEEGAESRQQAMVELMVDLLLDMEGISVSQGLVYVLDELESYPLEFLAIELLKRGANLETKDDYGYTPFLKAVKNDAPGCIVDLLLERGADVHAVAEDRKTALHFAAQKSEEQIIRQMIKSGLSVDAEDKDGWTPLHEAARYGSKVATAILTNNGAYVNARDHRKRTPLHVAAEEGEKEVVKCLLSKKADAIIADLDGNAPVDLAAKKQHKEVVNILLKHAASSKKDNATKRTLEKVMNRGVDIKDGLVKEMISEMSPLSVVRMFKPKECGGEGKFKLIEEFAKNTKLKKSTKAIMDQFVVGKRRGHVFCEVIDADTNGIAPDEDGFDESTPSLLDVIVKANDKELAQHPAIRAMLDYKWKHFAKWLFILSLMVYAVRMLFFGLALLIAARPDLDNPGCYRDGWDYFRGICEGISILLFFFKLGDEIVEMFSLGKLYHEDKYNYMQLLAAFLPLLIIPFRAATTWCASTGDGYCVDPTLLSNTSNATNSILNINQACITASSIQWIIASLAYMANAVLVLEYLALSRKLGVYVTILKGIVVKDIIKFTVLFLVVLYIFVGSFYLALRAGVRVESGSIKSDVEKFSLQTLYPWHVVFTGIRILIDGEVFDGDYFMNDDNSGKYAGYKWFSIVMYLVFLFTVIVVLLNLLIAQMSDTYTKVQEDVEGTFAIARARIIARLQKGKRLFCRGKSYRKRYFEKVVWTELPEEQLKQDEQDEQAKEKVSLMEQKTDWLKEASAELTRRLQDREASAQKIKSRIEHKIDQIAAELTLRQMEREGKALTYKSVMEEKIDLLNDSVSRGLQNREDSAQQIKSELEEKIDLVTKMTDELTRRQQASEDAALQHKRLMEQKIDQLTEMTAEFTRRFQGWEKRWPFKTGAQ